MYIKRALKRSPTGHDFYFWLIINYCCLNHICFLLPITNLAILVAENEDLGHTSLWSWRNKQNNLIQVMETHKESSRFDGTMAFLVFISLATLFLTIRWCRQRNKQKRKKPKLRRLLAILQCRRIPSV